MIQIKVENKGSTCI